MPLVIVDFSCSLSIQSTNLDDFVVHCEESLAVGRKYDGMHITGEHLVTISFSMLTIFGQTLLFLYEPLMSQ